MKSLTLAADSNASYSLHCQKRERAVAIDRANTHALNKRTKLTHQSEGTEYVKDDVGPLSVVLPETYWFQELFEPAGLPPQAAVAAAAAGTSRMASYSAASVPAPQGQNTPRAIPVDAPR